jgi:proline racemase
MRLSDPSAFCPGNAAILDSNWAATGVHTVDYHTAGEPFRIVPEPPVSIPGATVAERRANAMVSPEVDGLRQVLCFEPRGHADMYGGFVTPPDDEGAHFGVLFWHKDGFSTACGHGTIALGTWAIESGRVAADPSGTTDVVIDVPSGRVTARVHTAADGRVETVDFVNVPSALVQRDIAVSTSRGPAQVDIGWGGAFYAQLDAASVGLTVTPGDLPALIVIGREIKAALAEHPAVRHPTDGRLNGVYGTVIFEELGSLPTGELHQRNVTIFADGQVDRSPCGSGTAARVAALTASGELRDGQTLVHDSIVGSRFLAAVQAHVTEDSRPAVVPVVTGAAYRVGSSTFTIDPRDPLVPGFVLR